MISALHSCSQFGVKSDLELFSIPVTQFSHEENECLQYYPITSHTQENDTIEFQITNTSNHYLDPSTMLLYMRGKIECLDDTEIQTNVPIKTESSSSLSSSSTNATGGGGTSASTSTTETNTVTQPPLAAAASQTTTTQSTTTTTTKTTSSTNIVIPCDNFANSWIEYVDVYLNNTLVSRHELYTYRAYLDMIMHATYATDVENHALLYDRAEIEEYSLPHVDHLLRYKRTSNENVFDCITPFYSDLCQQGKLLLNGVDIRIVIRQNSDAFRLITNIGNENRYRLTMDKLILYVKRIKISPSILVAHEKQLASQPALYPIRGIETKIRAILPNSSDILFENLSPEKVPTSLTVLFVETSSYYGHFNQNPLKFENLNLYQSKLMIGSKEIIDLFDFENNNAAPAYLNLLRHIGNPNLRFPFHRYKTDSFMLHYVLTPDCVHDGEHFSPPKAENVRLHIQLRKPTTKAYTAIILLEHPRIIEINAARQIQIK